MNTQSLTTMALLAVSLTSLAGCSSESFYRFSAQATNDGVIDVRHMPDRFKEGAAPDRVFTDFRMDLHVEADTGETFIVPGYFAGESYADFDGEGLYPQWHAKFRPSKAGAYTVTSAFCAGELRAIAEEPCTDFSGYSKTIEITEVRRPLTQGPTRYLQRPDGSVFLKTGAGSPENILAYADIDGTYSAGGIGFPALGEDQLHEFEAHVADWKPGDPTWGDGPGLDDKGKGIIGLFNYYADVGVNSQYLVGMNVEGDGQDVFPWVSHDDPYVFDVSKLAQWQTVFEHANDKGVAIHFLFTETENESFFEVHDGLEIGVDFAPSRKLYYREMVARFGHLPMLVWNLGEENGVVGNTGSDPYRQPTSPAQRGEFADFITALDARKHPIVAHNWPDEEEALYGELLGRPSFSGISLQAHHDYFDKVAKWTTKSAEAGRPWMVSVDEPLGWEFGARPDADVEGPRPEILSVLWPTLLGGGAGVEWYFGWQNNAPTSDLSNEDQRTRDRLWRASAKVRRFFETLPLTEMSPRRDGKTMILEGAGHRVAMTDEVVSYTSPDGTTQELDPYNPLGD